MPTFTTADAAERLASKQAAKQLGVSTGIGSGITIKIKKQNPLQSAIKGLGTAYNYAKNTPGAQLSTPINTGLGVSMGGQQNAVQNVVEPVRAAGIRAIGDVTAIPGVGKPSASPTAADFRAGNFVAPIVDYATLLATMAAASPKMRRPVGSSEVSPIGSQTESRLLTTGQRARQIRNEYSVPLDEALTMAKIESDFRNSALQMAQEMKLTGRDLQYWLNTVRHGSIDDIRNMSDELDRLWGFVNEMEGFGS